eukprot:1154419-Pelagomonas_calceolata.AAC.3
MSHGGMTYLFMLQLSCPRRQANFWIALTQGFSSEVTMKEKKRKEYACQVWPRALRKGHLKGPK